MNATKTVKAMISIAGALIMLLTSCTNPAGPSLNLGNNTPVIEDLDGILNNPATGLIAGLDLEGDKLLTNPDVTISDGIKWVEGLSGNAIQIDRVDDPAGGFLRITDGSLPEFTLAGSIEVWVKPEINAPWAGILHKGQETNFSDESWSLQYDGGNNVMFNLNSETAGTSVNSGTVLELNIWHHIAVTWYVDTDDKLSLAIYIDGELKGSASVDGFGPVKDSAGDLIVGSQLPVKYNDGFGYISFLGLIDEISLYDVERTADEILADYNLLKQ